MRDYVELVNALRDPVRACNAWDAADAIEELLAKVPTWISVEERLPNEAVRVLTYSGDIVKENWLFTVAFSGGERKEWKYMDGFVTHWMPLPAPPKGVE